MQALNLRLGHYLLEWKWLIYQGVSNMAYTVQRFVQLLN